MQVSGGGGGAGGCECACACGIPRSLRPNQGAVWLKYLRSVFTPQQADDRTFPAPSVPRDFLAFPYPHPPPPLPSVSPDHSSLLLHVKQFVSDLRSLSCQMSVLQGNGEGVGVAQSCLPAQPTSP